MYWPAIALAAISAGVAVVVTNLLLSKEVENKTSHRVMTFLLFLILHITSKTYILPEIESYNTKNEIMTGLNKIPAYNSIKEYSPDVYNKLVYSINQSIDRGYTPQQIINVIGSQVSTYVKSRVPHASDEAILSYMKVMISELEQLHSKGNGLCYQFLYPSNDETINIFEHISPETRKNDLATLNEIIKTSQAKRAKLSDDEIMPSLEPIFINLYKKYGDDINILNNPKSSKVNKSTTCSITIDMFKSIVALPPTQAANSIRWMFDQ